MRTPGNRTSHRFRRISKALVIPFALLLVAALAYAFKAPPGMGRSVVNAVFSTPAPGDEEPCPCHGDTPLPEPNPLPAVQNTQAAVDYHTDVRPIIEAHCLECHQSGGVAPFPFENYDEVASYALAISDAVESRRMPPFLADNSGSCQTFRHARWLEPEEIATVTQWVSDEFPEGVPPAEEPETTPVISMDFSPDLAIDFAGEYTPTPGDKRPDSFRCFPIRTDLASERYITGFHLQPGNVEVVHHVNVWAIDSEEGEKAIFDAAKQDEQPGFSCYTQQRPALRWIAGWAPGAEPTRWPEGTGLPLQAEQVLLLEVHYFGEGRNENSQLLLETTETPRTDIDFISVNASRNFKLPPGREEVEVTQSFRYDQLRKGFQLLGIAPHMHTYGQTLRLRIRSDDEEACLINVDRWDFHRQQGFFYETPLEFSFSDDRELTIECTYDTSEAEETLTYGMNTENEMCQALLVYIPAPMERPDEE